MNVKPPCRRLSPSVAHEPLFDEILLRFRFLRTLEVGSHSSLLSGEIGSRACPGAHIIDEEIMKHHSPRQPRGGPGQKWRPVSPADRDDGSGIYTGARSAEPSGREPGLPVMGNRASFRERCVRRLAPDQSGKRGHCRQGRFTAADRAGTGPSAGARPARAQAVRSGPLHE